MSTVKLNVQQKPFSLKQRRNSARETLKLFFFKVQTKDVEKRRRRGN